MSTIIVSFSQTGNNSLLASKLADELTAEKIQITLPKTRSFLAIGLDMLLNRTPKINPIEVDFSKYDLVIFVGPVWMGQVASPFRAIFRQAKGKLKMYAFVSLSGGADGPNEKLAGELKKRLGKKPIAIMNLLIYNLLPQNPKPTRQQTEDYRLNDEDAMKMVTEVVQRLKKEI